MFSVKATLVALAGLVASVAGTTGPTAQFGNISPTNAMLFLNGFHFISGNSSHYLHANHHCSIMSADFIQCAVFAPGSNPARLAGIEYIVSGRAFAKLPFEERVLWHSHSYEVKSGLLTEPGLPATVDDEVMKILIGSYGKTFHTWRYDQRKNSLPLGIPELVNGYTGDGQIDPAFVESRDVMFGVNTTLTRQRRKNMKAPKVIAGADSWKYGYVLNLGITNHTRKTTFP